MFDFNNPMSRGTSYPFGNGLDMSKLQPNPAAQAHKPAAVDATAEGIAQVKRAMKLPAGIASSYNKKKTNCDPGEVSSRGVCKKKGRKKKASQDNSGQRLSSAGEESGVKYKIDTEGDKTGRSAFDTLDNYMKKAGLNSFQSSFFSRMVLEGSNIEGAIKQAEDKFGEKVASELKSGFEILEKQANKLKFLQALGSKALDVGKGLFGKGTQKAVQQGAQKGVQQGARGGQKALTGEVVKRLPGPKPPTSMVKTPNFRIPPGGAANPGLGQKALDAGKGFFTGAGARQQLGQGAAMGAMNPFTGFMSDQAFDEQGNLRVGHLLKQTALGALGGRSLGKIPGVNQDIVRSMGNRMMAGSGAGYGAGIGANIAGYDVDPTTMAQLGFGGGALLPGNLTKMPGIGKRIQNMKPGKMKDFLSRELGSYGTATSKGVDPLTALSPLDLASNAVLGAAGRVARPAGNAVGNAALRGGQAAVKGYKGLSPAAQANANRLAAGGLALGGLGGGAMYLGNKMDQQANQFRQEMQPYLDGAKQTMNRTNQFMDNPVGGMLGGLGDTFKQNPWLLPLLLGGGGAALGGLAGSGQGGGGAALGATLGGIGLPLLYMMSQGKGLGDLFPGGQQNVAQTQQQMANQDESTRAAQQAQNPVATQNTDQQDEFARQGAQQFAEANPGMMDGGMFDFTGYDQDEMAQLFAKASPQQQRILQDPSIPEATKGQILEQIAQG